MGTPAPLVTPGVHVPACWDPGKPFSSAATPKFITVDITGTVKGPSWVVGDGEPLNGRWTVEQEGSFTPRWRLRLSGTPDVRLVYGSGGSSLSALNTEGQTTFRKFGASACSIEFESDLVGRFQGGTATITIPS